MRQSLAFEGALDPPVQSRRTVPFVRLNALVPEAPSAMLSPRGTLTWAWLKEPNG